MITARYKVNDRFLLLDFERPIFQSGIPPNFYINGIQTAASPGTSTDSLWIEVPSHGYDDDLVLEYRPEAAAPLLYLSGPASDRIVPAFSRIVVIEQISSEIQDSANTSLTPVLGDFIDAYGLEEAIMISNPDNALATSPDEYKFLRAFEDAQALWSTYLLAIDFANRAAINAGKRRTLLIFARYFLDSRCRRKNVTEDYERAIANLTKVNETAGPVDPTIYTGEDGVIYGSQTCGTCTSDLKFKNYLV
jgi:phage gp36-like protein